MYGFQKRSSRPQAHPQKLADGGEVRNKQSSPPDAEASSLGFGPGSRAAALLAQATGSGPIRGPGTGTSDSVKTSVPPGSYIVPADSVAQIGEQNIAALGFRPGINPADRAKPQGPAPGLGFGSGSVGEALQAQLQAPAASQPAPGLGFGPASHGAGLLGNAQALTEGNPLPGLGFKSKTERESGQGAGTNAVPVNLSNGEFQVSPEQLQAIGARVLEQLKNATHTPVQEQRSTDALYFVNGGVVEDDRARLRSPSTGNNPVTNLPALDPARTSSGQIGGPATTRPAAPAASPVKGPLDSLGTAYGETLSAMVPSPFESRSNAIRDQNREGLIAEPEKPAVPPGLPAAPRSPAAASAPVVPGSSAAGAAANEVDQPGTTTSTTPPNSGPVPYTVTPVENTNGVQRINQPGKSPLFTNIDPGQAAAEMKGNPVGGFQPASLRGDAAGAAPSGPGLGFGPGSVSGSADVLGILQRESQIRAGMGELQDQINFNDGNGIGFRQAGPGERGFTTIRDGARAERDRVAVMDAALKPLSGARNGQLTANQLRTAQGMVEADQRNEQSRYQTDTNAATQLETTGMRETGENQRTGAREAGASSRANASNLIQQGELGLRQEVQGFQTRAARRQEDLQARYEAAKTPEERSAIAQQIRDLSGKQEPQNRFTVVPGGQEIDPTTNQLVTRPARVINNQTGAFVDQTGPAGANQQAVAMPAEKSKLVSGQTYQTARGPARWDGKQFIGV